MVVGVIGCGRMGGALACALHAAGHELLVAGRPGSTSATRLAELLVRAAAVPVRVLTHEAEVVMMAVPFYAALDLMRREAAHVDARRPLVDVTNPMLDIRGGAAPMHGPSGGEVLAGCLPHWHVVKAFNTVSARLVGTPVLDQRPITVPIASSHTEAKARVCMLARQLGFDAVDAGGIERSRELESLAVLLASLGSRYGLGSDVGFHLERRRICPPSTDHLRTPHGPSRIPAGGSSGQFPFGAGDLPIADRANSGGRGRQEAH